MIAFIVFIIFVLVAMGLVVGALFNTGTYRAGLGASAVAVLIVGGLILILGGIQDVPVKNVGVATSFGKVEGFMPPGLHWAAPWTNVYNIPETVQTTTFEGGFDSHGVCQGLDVRIGGQQQGCLDATIQWQVRDSAAAELFNLYNTGGNVLSDITNAVVVREFKVAANQVMGDYNPIQDVALNSGAGNSQFSSFGPSIEAAMKKDIGTQIVVRSVLVPFLHYDNATQTRLNAIQQQYGATAIADQQVLTNKALAAANAAISTKSLTPAALEAECYSIVQEAVKNGYALPAGFSCTGAGSTLALSTK